MEDALDFQLAEHQNEETTHYDYELEEEDEMGYFDTRFGPSGKERTVLRRLRSSRRES